MIDNSQAISLKQQANYYYWQQKLSGNLPALELPSDRPRTATISQNYGAYNLQFSSGLITSIQEIAKREDSSSATIILAIIQVFLYRYTHQEDLVLLVASLDHKPSSNSVVLRTSLQDELTFKDLLVQVDLNIAEALAHPYPTELLIAKLLPELTQNYFKVRVSYLTEDSSPQDDKQSEIYDLVLEIGQQANSITFKYNRDLFDEVTVARWAKHWQNLVTAIAVQPATTISQLPLLSSEEQEQLLTEWNQTQVDYPQDHLIHQLFETQVAQNPDALAVVFADQTLTYRELNQRANQLAHYLQSLGVQPETLVGICIERSVEMVIGLVAILKAGGAYVPIDPNYPSDRLSYMLEDSQVKILLSQESLTASLPSHQARVICLDSDWSEISQYNQDNPNTDLTWSNLAYVIYTSGSTGKPKGVMNTHFGIHNRLRWMQEVYQLNGSDRVLQKTPFSFDVSVWEFFWTLMTGASIVVAKPEGHKDSGYLVDLIEREGVTTLHFVPSMLQVFLQESDLERCYSLKRVFCSGEALPFELTQRFFDRLNCQLHNLYGPTEAAIDVTFWECQPDDKLQVVPIGRPIANTQTHILDKHFQPVPIGVLGELYLGGHNLARGYLNRPELTAEKFISIDNNRFYKTGDLARYRNDGNIEYLGRIDHQVKLRGFRIELGEIEAVLDTYPQIQQTVVLATDDLAGNKQLVAYIATNNPPSIKQLREFLATQLPEYMIPSIFIPLESIPLTPNGKVDRRALPAPDIRQQIEQTYQAPSTVEEKLIADIWKTVLKLDRVGIEDNFFELGGNSLLGMQIVSRIREGLNLDLPLDALFNYPTIAELSGYVCQQNPKEITTIGNFAHALETNQPLPLSSSERSLWFFEKLHPQTAVYNIPLIIKLQGSLDIEILEQSINRLIQRHQVFRTIYPEVDGAPHKIVIAESCLTLEVVRLQEISIEELQAQATLLAQQEAQQPFDLGHDSLIRAKLLSLSENQSWLLITCHHIIFDGWSIQILVDELAQDYHALKVNSESELKELKIQYLDYAHWQQQWLQTEACDRQLNYWHEQLQGSAPLLELPTDRPRPAVQNYQGDRYCFELPLELSQALNSLSRQEGVTLYMTLLAAFKVLLARYTRETDIIVGTPFANRNSAETEPLIGFLVNTLVLRTNLEDDLTFKALLSRILKVTSEAYTHGSLPFEKLVESLQPERDLSYNPLFQIMFALQKQVAVEPSSAELTWDVTENSDRHISMFDLTLDLIETPTGIQGHWEYNTDLFNRETISRINRHWQTLLQGIIANPDTTIAHLPLLTPQETQQILTDWNQPQVAKLNSDSSFVQLFETQVAQTPDAIAVEFQSQKLTYQELNQQANQLARHLQTLGVGVEALVGVCVDRSLEMIVGILGILKAGGAYVPLDPKYPPERLAYMVEDAQINVLLTQSQWQTRLPDIQAQTVLLDGDWSLFSGYNTENIAIATTPDNLAYVIYTSGSTGKPKGVMITQRGLSSFIQSAVQVYNIENSDRILQFASINFDAAVEEIFPCLIQGATLILRTQEMLADCSTFFQACQQLQLTVLGLPTAYWHQLAGELKDSQINLPPSLRLVMIGGEAVMSEPVKHWHQHLAKMGTSHSLLLVNSYGPTEVTVVATTYDITSLGWQGEVPIGRPLPHLQTYILDRHQQPVPIGIPGELYISGDSLARGYLNRPELTAEKFISINGNRLYKTGDLVRYLPDGNIEYVGRIDNQVKIRGFRIELGEIEAGLLEHPQIDEAVVTVYEDTFGNKNLCAYLVDSSKSLTHSTMRVFLQERLPNYMLPSSFTFLDKIPLTPSNKLDRKALPAPDSSRQGAEIAPPTNEVETILVDLWSEVLGVHPLGIHDNFFDLGGHSLLAVKLFGAIERQFGRKLPLTVLFEAPTIAELATILQNSAQKTNFKAIVTLKTGKTSSRPLFLVHDADGETMLYHNLASYLSEGQTVYGIRPYDRTGALIQHTRISEIVAYYIEEIRKVQPQGPYLIGGFCAGGVLAFEIACQLQAQGETVPLVAIIDGINSKGTSYRSDRATQERKQGFLKALQQQTSAIAMVKVTLNKVTNLVGYEINQRVVQTSNNLRIKLLRYCHNRGYGIPQFCQNIPLREIYTFAEADYQPAIYQGQITLWRATEKLNVDNPAIDDTPAIWEVHDPLLGWGDRATEGVIAHDIPGGHSSMLQAPHVQTMARLLQDYI